MPAGEVLRRIVGRSLGLTEFGNIATKGYGSSNAVASATGLEVTRPAVDAVITVSAEVADVRTITIQLKDANGVNINYVENVEIIMLLNAAGLDFVATGGSTGIAATVGKVLALVAKKVFKGLTTATGAMTVTWTDTGTEVAFLGLRLPNGRLVISSALTNA